MAEKKINDKTIAYIGDWQRRTREHQKKYSVIVIIAVVITFIVCTLFFVRFKSDNYNRVVDINMKYVQNGAIQEANQIERRLNNSITLIKKYAKQYVTLSEESPELTIEEKLTLLCDRTIFDRIAYIAPDGTDISLEGTCNVSDRQYFQDAMNGKKGYRYLTESKITGEPTLIFYAPIRKDDKIIGVMAGFFENDRMDDMFSYDFFNFAPDSYLLSGSGIVLANSNDKYIGENLIELLKSKEFRGDVDYDGMIEAIEDKDRTSVGFTFMQDNHATVGVVAQFIEKDWMIITILPYEVTNEMIDNANRAGHVLIFSVIISFLVLIGIFFTILKRRYKRLEYEMTLTSESLIATFEKEQKQAFIIESLGNTFSSVYYIDIATNDYERIVERDLSSLNFPGSGSWHTNFTEYLDKLVADTSRDNMERFLDISKFQELLGNEENISSEYLRTDNTWRKAFMIPAEYDADRHITSVIFAVQKIEAEKKKELETQRALKEAYDAAQLANNAKTTFLSNMSHDIRTPMNAIVGMTAIAGANLQNPDKVSDCLKKITGASRHLLGLINEVLDMSKIESGKVDLNEENFSLSDIIDELLSMNQSLIKEKGHTLTVKVNSLTHENVIGDRTRLQQVFNNFLTNAIKYTPAGGKLDIIVTEKPTKKSTVGFYEIKFCDNGIGISEEFKKTIFEPFTRADDNRISQIQGTGLGMPIARNIIRMMNGDITVESEINKGSVFTVSFTLKLQVEDDINISDFVDLPILVVDDEVSACEITCAMLDSLSMQSEWVTNGRDAVKKTVKRHKKNDDYYAIIMDWKMPDMNGIETTREIRKRVGNEVPIIVLTAYDFSEVEQEAKDAGVNAFLSKPLFKSRLIGLFKEFRSPDTQDEKMPTDDLDENDFSGKRILLAEDNELNREIAVEILTVMGLSIDTVENGKLCAETFESSPEGYYDLIFMDIQMPVMNGYEAAEAIRRSSHADAVTIPIVAMTANAFSSDVRQAFEAGMNDHVSKPIDINNIVSVLNKYIK